jgi:hypothetical protein
VSIDRCSLRHCDEAVHSSPGPIKDASGAYFPPAKEFNMMKTKTAGIIVAIPLAFGFA